MTAYSPCFGWVFGPIFWQTLHPMNEADEQGEAGTQDPRPATQSPAKGPQQQEIGGRQGPDPTRYGDWELRGRCIDF